MTAISKKLERVQLKDTQIKLNMPQRFLDQVKWLCKEIPKVEWSGVLFYSMEGSIQDPENMVITVENILPMHKGTSGYTEYSFDERVINYMMDTPGADDWKMGHIHSHNTMNVFFSGTDWSELEDNAPNHNFYLSLIVNNFMEFCAKVAFIVKSDKAQFTAKDEHGAKYHYSVEALEQQKMVTYDCDIHTPSREINVEESFIAKVDGIIKDAETRAVAAKKLATVTTNTGSPKTVYQGYGTGAKVVKQQSLVGKPNPGSDAWEEEGDFWGQEFGPDASLVDQFGGTFEDQDEEDVFEDFAKFVINTGNDISQYKDLQDVLETAYKPFALTPKALTSGVIEKYLAVYNKYFDKVSEKDTPDMFEQMTNGVIEVINVEVYTTTQQYVRDMLRPVSEALQNLLNKFMQYESDTV